MTEIKLKPCPFCGGEAEFKTIEKDMLSRQDYIWVRCSKCEATSKKFESNLYSSAAEDAAKAWNRRIKDETD